MNSSAVWPLGMLHGLAASTPHLQPRTGSLLLTPLNWHAHMQIQTGCTTTTVQSPPTPAPSLQLRPVRSWPAWLLWMRHPACASQASWQQDWRRRAAVQAQVAGQAPAPVLAAATGPAAIIKMVQAALVVRGKLARTPPAAHNSRSSALGTVTSSQLSTAAAAAPLCQTGTTSSCQRLSSA
jgi:hypothetical protein